MLEKYIDFQQAKIYYKVYGKGMPIVLLHGFGEDSSIWDNQVELLKNKYLLIVPDIPGSGKSTMIKNSGLEDYADGIKKILEEENIEKAVMIGHSIGGYISLAFAEKYPEHLSALGLFHSSAYADDAAKVETRKKGISFIETHGAEAFLKTTLPGLFFNQEKHQHHIDDLIKKSKNFSSEALIQYYHAMIARHDTTHVLISPQAKQMPILFIIGEHDKAVPFAHSLQQSHLPRISNINILRNSAHMGMLEETKKSNEILVNFLLTID